MRQIGLRQKIRRIIYYLLDLDIRDSYLESAFREIGDIFTTG